MARVATRVWIRPNSGPIGLAGDKPGSTVTHKTGMLNERSV